MTFSITVSERGDLIETGFGKRKNTISKIRGSGYGFFRQSLQFKNVDIRHSTKSFTIHCEDRKKEKGRGSSKNRITPPSKIKIPKNHLQNRRQFSIFTFPKATRLSKWAFLLINGQE
jgi:hypothetical protein